MKYVGLATGNVHLIVLSSTFSRLISWPSICQVLRLLDALTTPGSRMISFQVNIISSAPNGWPSDHLMPLTRFIVSCLPSSDHVQLLAILGSGSSLSPRSHIGPVISRVSTT